MNINLREEETDKYVSLYRDYLEKTQLLNKKVTDVLNEVMQQSRYDKLQQRISQIIDVYTETIVDNIETGVFSAWQESDASLKACVRTYKAGDAAEEVCVQIEQQMDDMMQDTLKIEKADWIVTERPIVSEDGLERLEDICRTAEAEVRNLRDEYIGKIETERDGNDIYGTLKPLVQEISQSMDSFFAASLQSFVNLHDFVRGISVQLQSIAEENGVGSGGLNNRTESGGGLRSAATSGQVADEEVIFEGENFSEENIKLCVIVVEKIVRQVGVIELNNTVDRNYDLLISSRSVYSGKTRTTRTVKAARTVTTQSRNVDLNIYGRYTVTNKSIQMMAPVCAQANAVLESIEKFYKEKFEKMERGFDKANKVIHAISSFLVLWGLGAWNLSGMFSTEDSGESILKKLKLGGVALASCNMAGKVINGGAFAFKILDWAMPYMKKSKTLVKLNEKFWNLTRQDMQAPYAYRMMDQYMMEYYEIKYGMTKGQMFTHYHNVTVNMDDNHQRRVFESAVFSAETMLTPQNYTVTETDPVKYVEICYGIFLNLVRSGMCNKQGLEAGTANDIVDRLYNSYVSLEAITPRVEIDPGKRMVG